MRRSGFNGTERFVPVDPQTLLCLPSFQGAPVFPAEVTERISNGGPVHHGTGSSCSSKCLHDVKHQQGVTERHSCAHKTSKSMTHRATGEAIFSFLSRWSNWTLKSDRNTCYMSYRPLSYSIYAWSCQKLTIGPTVPGNPRSP